jgi:hypothetical protein
MMRTRRLSLALAGAAAIGLAGLCAVGAADVPEGSSRGSEVQDIPAVIVFKDSAEYKGTVRLDYGGHPSIPAQDATVKFDDGQRHKPGYVVVPDGWGTFATTKGLTFRRARFVDGYAYGPGTLVVPPDDERAQAGIEFTGTFVHGQPFYGTAKYTDGSTYTGYFQDGCYASAPASPPEAPPGAPPGLLTVTEASNTGTYEAANHVLTVGTWEHTPGTACSSNRVRDARVTYPSGDVYAGDLDESGRYVGFGASYDRHAGPSQPSDVLLCGTRLDDGRFDAGEYVVTIGRFNLPAGDARSICAGRPNGATTMVVAVAEPRSQLSGEAAVRFANGDRERAPIRDGVLEGPGIYALAAYPATLSGRFAHDRLTAPVVLSACGRTFPVVVHDGVVANVPRARQAYLFHECDWLEAGRGGTIESRGLEGYGTEHLGDGETIAGRWRHGQLTNGTVIARLGKPYDATIRVERAHDVDGHLSGDATIRYANGDVARGRLDATSLATSALEGAGDYRYAATGCTARGTFHEGKMRGPATLYCPHDSPYAGVVGSDGTVQ